MKKILITGSAGFIGFHLAKLLSKEKNVKITLVDNMIRGRVDEDFKKLLSNDNINFEKVDISDKNNLNAIDKYYDEVYQLAAIIGVKHCMKRPFEVLVKNIEMVKNVIKLAKKNDWKNIFFSSSSEVYSGGYDKGIVNIPTNEEVPLCIDEIKNPRYSYALSKMVGEQLFLFGLDIGRVNLKIGRLHNIYGPRMGYAHVIPEVIKRIIMKENPFHIYGYNQTRAFCYVDDAVRMIKDILRCQNNDNIYHIGNPSTEITMQSLIKKLFKISGFFPKVKLVEGAPGSVDRRCPDISKIIKHTNIVPEFNLNSGLNITYEWYKKDIINNGAWE